MCSKIALKIFSMLNNGTIKSNYQFWKEFGSLEKIKNFDIDTTEYEKFLLNKKHKLTCVFDDDFPKLSINKLKKSEKPFIFAYKGNIDLLNDISNNIAVIGTLYPIGDIAQREQNIIKDCVENNFNIISGIANGCDTIAHSACLDFSGKTIAILPTALDNIYPLKNKQLAENIINNGGLIITEYMLEAKNKYERIKRFIERDRLQAMFSKAVILIASNRHGEGDSGSRHAMEKAKEYGRKRFVMFNEKTDKNNPIFGLNEDLLKDNASVLTHNSIKKLSAK